MPRRSPRPAALVAAFLAAVTLCVAATPAIASEPTSQTPVMGPNLLSAQQLANWYAHKRAGMSPPRVPGVNNDMRVLAQMFIEEGRTEGVRGDIAFVQSVLETGWFTFPDGGQIRPEFNNFAGIYAYNGRTPGTTCAAETAPSRCFPSARIGIRTQIHLLRGYADPTTRYMTDRLKMPPSDRIGVAPIWELFGGASGKAIWATAVDYGIRIIGLYSDALVYNGARAECLPYSPGGNDEKVGAGYWLVTNRGAVYHFGEARGFGSASSLKLAKPIVGGESRSDGLGYWLAGSDGGIFTYGLANFYGSTGNMHLNGPVVGMERTDNNAGYWLVAFDGGIFTFGNARFYGSTGNMVLNRPILGMERTASGKGYWLFASDGGIFSFGDARFYGSLGDKAIPAPIVSMQRTPSGKGYWMLGANGRVYRFGDAKFYGDVRGCTNYGAIAELLVSPTGKGYWIATADGSVIALGDARRHGFPARAYGKAVGLLLRA